MDDEPRRHISPRLRDALVADLVMGDITNVEPHDLEVAKFDPHEWTLHLGRQLGFARTSGPGDVHATLDMLIDDLDQLLRDWRLPPVGSICDDLATQATKSLSGPEAYYTLLAGPEKWRRAEIRKSCRVDRLEVELRTMAHHGLRAELQELLARWERWDVRKLRDNEKWKVIHARAQRGRPIRQAATPSRRSRTRAERAEAANWRRGASYQPPGRTF